MAQSNNQEVNFSYGFELRGERSVERGLDSILQRFIQTGNVADAAGLAVERFGRIFEVGIPVALGAAAIGLGVEKLEKMGEEAVETRRKIDDLSSIPINILDTGDLESNLNSIQELVDKIAPAQGKSYGQQLIDNIGAGISESTQDLGAFIQNHIGDPLAHLITGGQSVASQSYEQENQLGPLQQDYRDQMSALQTNDIRSNTPAFQHEKIASMEENATTPQGKFDVLSQKNEFATATLNYDTGQSNATQKQVDSFNQETEGRDLTSDEMKKGLQLEKMITAAKRLVLEDLATEHETSTAVTAAMRENASFRPDSVIASHGRRIGGGGRVYSAPHAALHGLGGSSGFESGGNHVNAQQDATLKATDYLKGFTEALKEGEATIKAATGGSLNSSTPTF